MLHHELGTTAPDNTSVLFTSTMVQYGIPGSYSAMARTVGIVSFSSSLYNLDIDLSGMGDSQLLLAPCFVLMGG